MSPTPLTALSPLDGGYHGKVDALRDIFSEFGLIQRRVQVELAWLKALSECADIAEVPAFSSESTDRLDQILADFDEAQLDAVRSLVNGVVNKVLHEPSVRLRADAGTPRGERNAAAVADLFDLE